MSTAGERQIFLGAACPTEQQDSGLGSMLGSMSQAFRAVAHEFKREGNVRGTLPELLRNAFLNLEVLPAVCRLGAVRPFKSVVFAKPRFLLRCLTTDYLARSFNVSVGARCFVHHHTRMQKALSSDLLQRILLTDVPVYELSNGEQIFTVTVGQVVAPSDKEGEWSLNLCVDGEVVYLLCFTIVPGWAVGSQASEVMLISRIQGVPGRYPEVKVARKAMADVAPNALLLAAAQGIASALGIEDLAVVAASDQTWYREEIAETLRRSYDDFPRDLGFEQNEAGFHTSSIPLHEKPMSEVKQGHKIRTREKRALKAAVTASCQDYFHVDMARKRD